MSWIIWLAVAMLGSALTLASFVKVLHATFLCKPSPEVQQGRCHDGTPSMLLPLVVLARCACCSACLPSSFRSTG